MTFLEILAGTLVLRLLFLLAWAVAIITFDALFEVADENVVRVADDLHAILPPIHGCNDACFPRSACPGQNGSPV